MWYLEKRTGIEYGKPELKYQPFYLITIWSQANYSTSLNLGLHINKLNYLDIADTTPVQWYFCIGQSHQLQIGTLCLYNNCKMRSLPGKWLCFVLLTMQINHSQVWCIYWYFRLERKTPPLFIPWDFFERGHSFGSMYFLECICKFSIVSEKGWITVALAYDIHWRKQGWVKKKSNVSLCLLKQSERWTVYTYGMTALLTYTSFFIG